jgi:hypothetical protein
MRLTMPAMHYPRKMGVRGQLRCEPVNRAARSMAAAAMSLRSQASELVQTVSVFRVPSMVYEFDCGQSTC